MVQVYKDRQRGCGTLKPLNRGTIGVGLLRLQPQFFSEGNIVYFENLHLKNIFRSAMNIFFLNHHPIDSISLNSSKLILNFLVLKKE